VKPEVSFKQPRPEIICRAKGKKKSKPDGNSLAVSIRTARKCMSAILSQLPLIINNITNYMIIPYNTVNKATYLG
jgi:hypothetical protein